MQTDRLLLTSVQFDVQPQIPGYLNHTEGHVSKPGLEFYLSTTAFGTCVVARVELPAPRSGSFVDAKPIYQEIRIPMSNVLWFQTAPVAVDDPAFEKAAKNIPEGGTAVLVETRGDGNPLHEVKAIVEKPTEELEKPATVLPFESPTHTGKKKPGKR